MREFSRTRRSSFGSFIVDAGGTILGFDEAMEQLTAWPAVEVVGHNKNLALPSKSPEQVTTPVLTLPLYDGTIPLREQAANHELTLHCRDGRRLEVESHVRPLSGPGQRSLVTILRVLARSAEESTVSWEGRDGLTGLPDRNAFAARLSADFLSAAAAAHPLAVILVDVDHLRRTNDRHGREAGDEVLRRLAGILRVAVEDERRIARLGDDDFAVLLANGGRGEARQVAAALRSTVERTRFLVGEEPGSRPQITISLGAASFPADADSEQELIGRAREALDEARSMGRNRVWCYLRRPRVPVQVPVFFDGSNPLLVGYTRDLSPSGIFVQTTADIDVGMRCALAFPLPGRSGKVHVVGRIVRTVQPQVSDDSPDLRIPGLGVEFERFGGTRDRRAIESFLHEHEAQTLRPEDGILSVS